MVVIVRLTAGAGDSTLSMRIFAHMITNQKFGIDIGRVVIAGDTDQPNSFFSRNFLQAPESEGAISTIHGIVQKVGTENVCLVSKCGEATAIRTLQWLSHKDFFARTGISPEQVHFCRERHEKRGICEKLGIEIFIDDRYTVLEHLTHLQILFLFNPNSAELRRFERAQHSAKNVQLVWSWAELGHCIGL